MSGWAAPSTRSAGRGDLPAQADRLAGVPEQEVRGGQALRGRQGARVVRPEHVVARLARLPQRGEALVGVSGQEADDGEVALDGQRVGVVLAQHRAAAEQDLPQQREGGLVAPGAVVLERRRVAQGEAGDRPLVLRGRPRVLLCHPVGAISPRPAATGRSAAAGHVQPAW